MRPMPPAEQANYDAIVAWHREVQARARAWHDIDLERDRQEEIGERKRSEGIEWRSCADPLMDGGDWTRFTVLGEEVGEVARATLETSYGSDTNEHLRQELIEVAAVAVAWVQAIDARNRP